MTEPFGVGGVQSDMLALSRDLVEKGHAFFLASRSGDQLDRLLENGARFVDIGFHFKGLTGFIKSGLALRRCVRQENIEVLAPQSVRTTIICYFFTRFLPFRHRLEEPGRRLPIVSTVHNIFTAVHFKYAGYIFNVCSDYVIFESHYERNRLLASGLSRKKSSVVHSGINMERFQVREFPAGLLSKYGLKKGRHIIFGIVARLIEIKGHRYLLEAFSRVIARERNARLIIIGDGPLLGAMKGYASRLGLNGAVIFTGYQSRIPGYLAILDVFVLASTRESFPLSAREAMAAGKAVILPDIGGCSEVVTNGETGLLFESGNVKQLADAMIRMIRNRKFLQYGSAGRKKCEKLFSRQNWVDKNEEIYMSYL